MRLLGCIDRIVDQQNAVIVIEQLKKEITVPILSLPQGSKEGSWLTFELTNHKAVNFQLQTDITIEKNKTVEEKLNRLRAKRTTSQFQRKN
ncbi:DUF3006 domain-containing protein [Alkalihalobacillus sp. LMS39]|uniref:DUF3006 domain-containing protein n=1 Tax=Alkalihalobacillus sp. LMS39 TaxID=2924032 RepID=UPI001FB31232|nr:DUF3006 domain-containing protein [Alkalihalobacillus sp. LMS39]UOE96248.1 DUF3006 domain-containing protein [Alkalihalobacillus sp. LMS39]